MLIDSVKYYVERRKSEIDSILERQDFLSELKTNLVIEHKYLSVRDTYMRLKDKIVEGLVREKRTSKVFEQRFLDRNFFKRERLPRNRDGDFRMERGDMLFKGDYNRQKHQRHKEIMQCMYVHHCDFFEFHKKKNKQLKKIANSAKGVIEAILKKKEDE